MLTTQASHDPLQASGMRVLRLLTTPTGHTAGTGPSKLSRLPGDHFPCPRPLSTVSQKWVKNPKCREGAEAWGWGARGAGGSAAGSRPPSKRLLGGQQPTVPGSGGRSSWPRCFSNSILATVGALFPPPTRPPLPAIPTPGIQSCPRGGGGMCLHAAFQGGASAAQGDPLPSSPVLPASPPHPHPSPAHACFRGRGRRQTRRFERVSFTATRVSSLCVLADPRLKIPSNCAQVGFPRVLNI